MPKIEQSLVVPFTNQQMYDLVNDVALYPQFVPWCKSAIVHSKAENTLHATLCVGKGLVMQTISTCNTMIPHHQINMLYQSGSFKSCTGSWRFMSQDNGCKVAFNMEYEFSNKLHALAIEPIFAPLANTLMEAFVKRAKTLYGS